MIFTQLQVVFIAFIIPDSYKTGISEIIDFSLTPD